MAEHSHVERAVDLLDGGDIPGAMRELRFAAEQVPIAALAPLVGRAAQAAGFTELAGAAHALTEDPQDTHALYNFGYGCVEHGVAYLAIPALQAALATVPQSNRILAELVAAYETESRHAEAVRVIEEHEEIVRPWPEIYLVVFNSLMAGDLDRAGHYLPQLDEPKGEDAAWAPAYQRVRDMWRRVGAVRELTVTGLGPQDLRGWHFALNGGLLGTLAPHGFDAGMTGRYAWLQDGYDNCRYGLERLTLLLSATGRAPATVSLLPDRSSTVLGLAAAQLLGVPAVPFEAGRGDTLVVAYTLSDVDDELVELLRERPDGQVLFEHATCWTEPPAVAADISTLLYQVIAAPWDSQLRVDAGSEGTTRTPPDPRPVPELVAAIVRADATPDPGDGETPPDADEALTTFATAVAPLWAPPGALRDRLWSPGPVPSNRFL